MVLGGGLKQGAATYNKVKDSWLTTAPMKIERWYSAAVKWNGTVVVTGGLYPFTASVEQFHPKTNQWTALPDLQIARKGHALVNIDSCLYAIGGLNEDEEPLSSIEKYNLGSKSWKLVSTLPTAREGLTCATKKVRDIFYALNTKLSKLETHKLNKLTPGFQKKKHLNQVSCVTNCRSLYCTTLITNCSHLILPNNLD